FGIRGGQGIEIGTARRGLRIGIVDRANLDDRGTPALIEPDGRVDEVRATKSELPNDVRRHVRVALFGEVAVLCAADEAGIARRAGGHDLSGLLGLALFLCRRTPAAAPATASTTALATLAASTAAAMPASVTTIVESAVAIAAIVAVSAVATVSSIAAIIAVAV